MIKAIVTDIEGTTTSIRFVYDVLFPYAKRHLGDFVRQHETNQLVADCINAVKEQIGQQRDIEGVISQLEQWMHDDQKITALKTLQGLVWEAGYHNGDYQGHVYPDAVDQLKLWQAQGIRLSVYSSGSIKAQQLLFAHTQYGDLQYLFDHNFDTTIGLKTEPSSYLAIIAKIGMAPEAILFLSDIAHELTAAMHAGMQVCCLKREGDLDDNECYCQVRDFSEIPQHFSFDVN